MLKVLMRILPFEAIIMLPVRPCNCLQSGKYTHRYFFFSAAHNERLQCAPNNWPGRLRRSLRLSESRHWENVSENLFS